MTEPNPYPPAPEPTPDPPSDPAQEERQKARGRAALVTAGSGLGCLLLGTMPFGIALILWVVFVVVRGC